MNVCRPIFMRMGLTVYCHGKLKHFHSRLSSIIVWNFHLLNINDLSLPATIYYANDPTVVRLTLAWLSGNDRNDKYLK